MGKLVFDLRDSTDEGLFHHLVKYCGICVIDFYADWCPPCKKLGIELDENLPKNENIMKYLVKPGDDQTPEFLKNRVVIMKVNYDEFEELVEQYDVKTIPHVIFYERGQLKPDIIRNCNALFEYTNSLLATK